MDKAQQTDGGTDFAAIWQEYLSERQEKKATADRQERTQSAADRAAAAAACRRGRIRFERRDKFFRLIEFPPKKKTEFRERYLTLVHSDDSRRQGKVRSVKRTRSIRIAHRATADELAQAAREWQEFTKLVDDLQTRLLFESEVERLEKYPLARPMEGHDVAAALYIGGKLTGVSDGDRLRYRAKVQLLQERQEVTDERAR